MSITIEKFMGGADEVALGTELDIRRDVRNLTITSATALGDLDLPDPTNLPMGGPYWNVVNESGVSIEIRDETDTLLATLVDDGVAIIVLGWNGTKKQWFVRTLTKNSASRTHL